MSSSGGPMWPICHTWSITDSFANPASSAVCATRLRSAAIVLGPPDQVNFETCTPSCMLLTLTTRAQQCGTRRHESAPAAHGDRQQALRLPRVKRRQWCLCVALLPCFAFLCVVALELRCASPCDECDECVGFALGLSGASVASG